MKQTGVQNTMPQRGSCGSSPPTRVTRSVMVAGFAIALISLTATADDSAAGLDALETAFLTENKPVAPAAAPAGSTAWQLVATARRQMMVRDFKAARATCERAVLEAKGEAAPFAKACLGFVAAFEGHSAEALETLKPLVLEKGPGALPTDPSAAGFIVRARAAAVLGDVVRVRHDGTLAPTVLQALDQSVTALGAHPMAGVAVRSLVALVDNGLDFTTVRALHEDESGAGAARGALAEALHAKLVRVLLHLNRHDDALAQAEAYLADYPNGAHRALVAETATELKALAQVEPGTIGVILPLSGQYRSYGELAWQALLLGLRNGVGQAMGKAELSPIREATEGGRKVVTIIGGSGPMLKVIVEDSKGDGDNAAAAFRRLARDDKAVAVLGAMLNAEAQSAALVAEELHVPLFTFARRDGLAAQGDFVFQHSLTTSMEARALVGYAMTRLGYKTFGILYPDQPYGESLTQAFWDEAERRNGEITGVESYPPDTTTFKIPIQKLVGRYHIGARGEYYKASQEAGLGKLTGYARQKAEEKVKREVPPRTDFDALFVPDYFRQASLIAPAVAYEDVLLTSGNHKQHVAATRQSAKPVRLLGTSGWHHPDLITRGGEYVRDALFIDGFYAASREEPTAGFVDLFKATTGKQATIVEAQAFDVGAVARALSIGTPAPKTRAEWIRALLSVKEFAGVTGKLTMQPNREMERPLYVLTVGRDSFRLVDQWRGEGVVVSPGATAAPAIGAGKAKAK
jgi:branched-chain amino acid transport system substrate-binding protein